MPLHTQQPIVRVEPSSMRTIETRSTENLFGLWSVFARCSPAMEDGKRYENMAWRLWSRETFCCQSDSPWSYGRRLSSNAPDVPELSTSVASDESNLESAITTSRSDMSASRPDLRRHDSATSQARRKHISSIGLEKVVNSIQEKKFLEPLSPLPADLAPPAPQPKPVQEPTPRIATPPSLARPIPEASTSTVATSVGCDMMSPALGSEASTSTEVSEHSVVRGFEPGHISTSIRSSTNLNPTPILKKTSSFVTKPLPAKADATKKKQPMFTLGGSSEEENCSSFEAYSMAQRSSLSEHLRKAAPMRKTTSFKAEVSTRTFQDATSESEAAIESDSDDDVDESAIEEEDSDDDDWEDDDNEESGPPSVADRTPLFQRVDSKPDLTSRRSLLTSALHQDDRAAALQNAASRSSPAIRRFRTSTPNGPSTGTSPHEDSGLMMRSQASRAKPIIMTTSNVHPQPAMSPKTTRRNMLTSELTGSLRQNLLWERQQKNATTNAVAKRQQSAANLPGLRRAMTTGDVKGLNNNNNNNNNTTTTTNNEQQPPQIKSTTFKDDTKPSSAYNQFFDSGLGDYHKSGW
ncbi:hypothetical protein ACJQWK_01954 [Exserohilum turcicum]|uniref:Nitrogen regulatory protein areA GATA-like domain-containing protein n=1 Tax=Exserohilum turcicum (strain 28A) TaxID=671987 RepID=R0K5H3_EXST2|nr:uncharacterized protein SETTUDRAFT_107771 [Exserohilum turcica Et28A]EOA88288.1 hypothetical protein SETTUDRAFT_107771 [Exserohilum turcica Et28A]